MTNVFLITYAGRVCARRVTSIRDSRDVISQKHRLRLSTRDTSLSRSRGRRKKL